MLNTYREILQQPEVLKWTADLPSEVVYRAAGFIGQARDVYIVGSGSSFHAGLFGSYVFSERNKTATFALTAGEFPYKTSTLSGNDIVIAISQSGEGHDIIKAVLLAKSFGSKVLAITNTRDSSLVHHADEVLYTPAGVEKGILATKTMTSSMAVFIMLSYALSEDFGSGETMLRNISSSVNNLIRSSSRLRVQKLCKELKDHKKFFVIGRNVDVVSALETALKLQEGAHVMAEGFSGSDFEHGPISMIEENSPLISFMSNDGAEKETLGNIIDVEQFGAQIIGIGPKPFNIYNRFFIVEDFGLFSPIISVVYGQLLAYFLAEAKGLNLDQPQNLTKIIA